MVSTFKFISGDYVVLRCEHKLSSLCLRIVLVSVDNRLLVEDISTSKYHIILKSDVSYETPYGG